MSNSDRTITFGTDGWRALIEHDYTFANVRACAEGVCRLLESHGEAHKGIVVGYDTRFGSPEFGLEVARVSTAHGIRTFLSDSFVPTPVVSYNLLHRQCGGGVVITASHNSGLWNGFKYKPNYAGSASPAIIGELEGLIAEASDEPELHSLDLSVAAETGLLSIVDMATPYEENIAHSVDLPSLRASGLRIGVDSMHGAASGYLNRLLAGESTTVTEIRSERNPAFPGMDQPEPIPRNLASTIESASNKSFDVVIATDGDGDRLGVIDENGTFISTLDTFALLCLHQLEVQGKRGPIVRSITQSGMIDKLAAKFNVPVYTTAVGFKYVGPKMMAVNALAAGEESGGYAFQGNIPERDGILSGLLFLDLMVQTGKTASDLVVYLHSIVGDHHYDRLDLDLQPHRPLPETAKLANFAPEAIAGLNVKSVDTTDGLRYVLDGGFWGLIRPSGTEPVIRIYAEGDSPARVLDIIADLRSICEL